MSRSGLNAQNKDALLSNLVVGNAAVIGNRLLVQGVIESTRGLNISDILARGNIRATGIIADNFQFLDEPIVNGSILTSDAEGNARWSKTVEVDEINTTKVVTEDFQLLKAPIAPGSLMISDGNGNASWTPNIPTILYAGINANTFLDPSTVTLTVPANALLDLTRDSITIEGSFRFDSTAPIIDFRINQGGGNFITFQENTTQVGKAGVVTATMTMNQTGPGTYNTTVVSHSAVGDGTLRVVPVDIAGFVPTLPTNIIAKATGAPGTVFLYSMNYKVYRAG